jgi:hypothetical protein
MYMTVKAMKAMKAIAGYLCKTLEKLQEPPGGCIGLLVLIPYNIRN